MCHEKRRVRLRVAVLDHSHNVPARRDIWPSDEREHAGSAQQDGRGDEALGEADAEAHHRDAPRVGAVRRLL